MCRHAIQLGSFSSVSQRHTVWSVLCPLNIFPVQADDDGSGGGDSFVGGQHRSTAVSTRPHESSWVNRGVQIVKKSKPNRIEIELLIEKSNRNRSKSIKPNRNITRNEYFQLSNNALSSNIQLHILHSSNTRVSTASIRRMCFLQLLNVQAHSRYCFQ